MADTPELRIAVDPASPAGDYTAKCEYRILADGRIRIERLWIEPSGAARPVEGVDYWKCGCGCQNPIRQALCAFCGGDAMLESRYPPPSQRAS